MSKINQIQNALKEIDGGEFQKLADTYIHKKGYQNINPVGSVMGANKVRKGTPDSYARQENGKLVFAEYTTDQTNIGKKLKGDLDKCLDVTKTGIPLGEIEEIIFCHNSQLSLPDEQELYNACKKNGIKIQVFGVESISFDLYQKYPALAQDFLGISIDTGQVLEPSEFVASIGKNQISTPLDTAFHCREEELKLTLKKIESNSLVILSGTAGVGKSRLALEAIENFKSDHADFELRVIYNKGPDLFEDIRSYFSQPGSFLLLVDDANRITQFDYIVDLLQNQRTDQNIKVIATVRDYARDKINNTAKPLGSVSDIEIKPMNSDEIKGFIEKQYDIKNSIYLDRIADIAGGNPRLAIMAAILAVKENSLESIRDVSALYDEYFSSISNDLKILQDKNILKVSGIISFFRTIDRSNSQAMELIQNVFGISSEDFWKSVDYLHGAEVVDVYEGEVVKISDQVFSTYLFYLCFFKDKDLGFSLLLENFFPSQISRLRDAIYPCLNSFDFDEIVKKIRPAIETKWIECSDKDNKSDLHELIKTFWFLLQSNVLLYVRDRIVAMEEQAIDLDSISFESKNVSSDDDLLLEILGLFRQADEESTFKAALDLSFRYIEKAPKAAPQFISLMADTFGFNRHSHRTDYLIQKTLIEALWKKTEKGQNKLFSRLFLEVASKYLPTKFDSHESSKRTITIHKFELLAIASIFDLRKTIWEGVLELYEIPDLRAHASSVLKSYCDSGYYLSQNEIVHKDAQYIIPFMKSEFNPSDFSECLLVQKYCKMLQGRDVRSTDELSGRFHSDIYALYKMLSFDYSDIEIKSIDEFDAIKKEKIESYSNAFGATEYKSFVEQSFEILSLLGDDHNTYQIRNAISQVFTCLSERDAGLYEKVIQNYLEAGNLLELYQPAILVGKLIKACGATQALTILEGAEYSAKKQWLFDFYRCISNEDISPETVEKLLSLYRESEPRDLPHDYDFLLNYVGSDENIVIKVADLIIERTEEDSNFWRCLDMLFNHLTEVNKRIFELFGDNLKSLKEVYLIHCKYDTHADYNGATLRRILSVDPNFILEIIDRIYTDDKWPDRYSDTRDYDFLWEHDDCELIVNMAAKEILKRDLERGYISGRYLERLFCVRDEKECSQKVESKQDKILENIINENALDIDSMRMMFKIISAFSPERRKKFVELFLNKNSNYKDFEQLSLEPDHWGFSGSAVPMYQARVAFWESLLALCDTVELLDHKLFIERNIQRYLNRVEEEKKSDFVDE